MMGIGKGVNSSLDSYNESSTSIPSLPKDTPQSKDGNVIAHKNMHGGAMHGFVSNGGEFSINNTFGIRFVIQGNKWVNIQIVAYNEGTAPAKQTIMRTKKEIVKVPVQKKKPKLEPKPKLEISKETKTKDAFSFD